MSEGRITYSSIPYYGVILIILSLYAVLTYVTPLYIDDWMFMRNWKEHAGSEGFSFSGWRDYYIFTRGYDNGRIANALAVFTSMFSPFKEIFPLLNGIMAAAIMVLCQRIVCLRKKSDNTLWLAAVWFCCLVFVPWNTLFVADYALNYIWGVAVNIGFLYLLLIREKRGWTSWSLLWALLFSVIGAGWHESLAVETICGLILLIVFRGRRLSRCFYAVFVSYLMFTVVFGFSQGMISRFGWEVHSSLGVPDKRVLAIWGLAVVSVLVFLFQKGRRRRFFRLLFSPVLLVCIGVCVSGYFIGMLTRNQPRAYFYSNIALVVCLLYMVRNVISHPRGINKYNSAFITILLTVFCAVQIIWTIAIQYRFTSFWEEIYAKLKDSESGIVYTDRELHNTSAPRFLLMRPEGGNLDVWWQYQNLWMYFHTPFISVIPEELRGVDYGQAPLLDGNMKARNVNGFLVTDHIKGNHYHNPSIPADVDLRITFKDKSRVATTGVAFPFILSRTGDQIYPDTLSFICLPSGNWEVERIQAIDSISSAAK